MGKVYTIATGLLIFSGAVFLRICIGLYPYSGIFSYIATKVSWKFSYT